LGGTRPWPSARYDAVAVFTTDRRLVQLRLATVRGASSWTHTSNAGPPVDVSRFAAGKLRLDVRPLDLVPVIEAALDVARPAAEAKRVRVHTALDPTTGLVNGDPDRLQQVVWNLLSNAVKFTPEGGSVWLTLGRLYGRAELRVGDTGRGLAPESLPHVFEPFWQAVPDSQRPIAGLGLGLTIVRYLVELHGGTVVAHSEGIGKGATVRVAIPLA
jgi:signal transduction histidine kinase